MRTESYAYHVERRDTLAFGLDDTRPSYHRFSAEGEDYAALSDALTVYGEQAAREAELMRKWTKARSLGLRCIQVRAFAGHL
jgi:hypothetical protein